MEPPSTAIRLRAAEMRQQGVDVRATAELVARRAQALPWTGRAADSMRSRLEERVRRLHAVADAHERAAEALERHADAVEGEGRATPW